MLHIRTFVVLTLIAGAGAAQTQQQPAAQTLPAFMGPCSNLSCEIQNDWTRNNVMVYGLARAMPEDNTVSNPFRKSKASANACCM